MFLKTLAITGDLIGSFKGRFNNEGKWHCGTMTNNAFWYRNPDNIPSIDKGTTVFSNMYYFWRHPPKGHIIKNKLLDTMRSLWPEVKEDPKLPFRNYHANLMKGIHRMEEFNCLELPDPKGCQFAFKDADKDLERNLTDKKAPIIASLKDYQTILDTQVQVG